MKKYIYIWLGSAIIFYFLALFLYFEYKAEMYPALSPIEVMALLICITGLFFSSITFHPLNIKFLNINKKVFYIEFVFRYLFFVAVIFGKFFNQIIIFYISCGFCILIEIFTKYIVFKKIKKYSYNFFLNSDKSIKVSFRKAFKEKTIRNITQIITIIGFILIAQFASLEAWLLCFIALIILPITWAIAEFCDVQILNKKNELENGKESNKS